MYTIEHHFITTRKLYTLLNNSQQTVKLVGLFFYFYCTHGMELTHLERKIDLMQIYRLKKPIDK